MLELFSLGVEVTFQNLDANRKAKESHLMCDGFLSYCPNIWNMKPWKCMKVDLVISCYKQTSSCEGVSYTWQPWIGITIWSAITTNPNHPEGNSQDPRELSIRCNAINGFNQSHIIHVMNVLGNIKGFRVTIVAINNLFVCFWPIGTIVVNIVL